MQDLYAAANANVENHLGDVVTEDHSEAMIAQEIYTLAFDGAVDAGADSATARSIAIQISGGAE